MPRYTVTKGDYVGTSDDRADRWYVRDTLSAIVDRRGAGYASKIEALEDLVENLQSDTDLVSVAEIAQRADVAWATVQSWRRRHPETFPEPLVTLKAGPIWSWPTVQQWIAGRR